MERARRELLGAGRGQHPRRQPAIIAQQGKDALGQVEIVGNVLEELGEGPRPQLVEVPRAALESQFRGGAAIYIAATVAIVAATSS